MDDLYSNFSLNSSSTYEINSFSSSFDEEITQEDAWVIINKYFESKGLVRQQLDSFDEFLQNSIQELIDDAGEIKIIIVIKIRAEHLQWSVGFFQVWCLVR